MKHVLSLVALSALMTSCYDGRGVLSLNQELVFNGIGKKTVKLKAKDYKAKFDIRKNLLTRKQRILLKARGKLRRIEIELPKSLNIKNNSNFKLTPSEIGQPFALEGSFKKTFDRSETVRDIADCELTERIKTCGYDKEGQLKIVTKKYKVEGLREVHFHYLTEKDELRADFLAPNSDDILATFDGGDETTKKVYDYKGTCFAKYTRPFAGRDYSSFPRPDYRRRRLPQNVSDCVEILIDELNNRN